MPVQALSQLSSQPLTWFWPNRLPLGKLSLLEGDPGLSKSLVTLDLCARLSTGRPLPDGTLCPGPAAALILNAEDGVADTVRCRLLALGADMDRVFHLYCDDGAPLRLPSQLPQLAEALDQTRARLVVIDPLMAFLERSINIASDQSVRRALVPLAQLADQHQCAVLMVRHLNKNSGLRSIYRGGGSIGLVGACRSAWLIARDPQTPDHCVLAQVKNNLAPPQPSLAYTVQDASSASPLLNWLGSRDQKTADQLLVGFPGLSQPNQFDRACDFLNTLLETAPQTARAIWTAAQKEGHSARTLARARRFLKIRSQRIWMEKNQFTYWLLPHQNLANNLPPENVPADLEPWLGPLREKFPPSTPLDDL
ncbi:MAG: AAA family ATPase [Planctomycetes bacterium]|nr:AAA family ATPase [Planctomycetota bacterium]